MRIVKNLKPAFILFGLIMTSCGGVTQAESTPVVTATLASGAEAVSVSGAADVFSKEGKIYIHEGGGFQFPMLKGWKGEQSEAEARLTYSDGGFAIVLNRSNTGIDLPHYALENFAFATEDSFYVGLDDYQLVNVNSDAENKTVTLEKTFEADDEARYLYSKFIQLGQVVYTLEFAAPADEWESNRASFLDFADSVDLKENLLEETPLYQVRRSYETPGGFFTYQIPASFFLHGTMPKDKTVIDTFVSPDQMATIQIISFDSGELMNAATTELTAIKLLNALFEKGKGNINIDAIFTQKADGRRRMDWYSRLGEYAGSTYYELRGTFLILSTFAYEEESAELYAPLMKDLAATYRAR